MEKRDAIMYSGYLQLTVYRASHYRPLCGGFYCIRMGPPGYSLVHLEYIPSVPPPHLTRLVPRDVRRVL
jgi:hypothetical protein